MSGRSRRGAAVRAMETMKRGRNDNDQEPGKRPKKPRTTRAPPVDPKKLKDTNDILIYITKRTKQLEIISNSNKNFVNFVNKQVNTSNLPRLKSGYKRRNLVAWAVLFKLFKKDIPSTQIPNGGVDEETINTIHSEIMKSNKYRFGAASNEVNSTPFVAPIDETTANTFIYLMWLDGIHDEYSPSEFAVFLKSPFYKTFFKKHTWKPNERVAEIQKASGPTTKGSFERKLKDNIGELFNINTISTISGSERFNVTNENKKIFAGIDQELRDNKPISGFVKGSNGIEPYISIGNLIDPGRLMPLEGVSSEVTNIIYFLNNPSTDFKLKNKYDIGPLKLTLTIKGTPFIDIDVSINKGIAQTRKNQIEKSSDYFSIQFNSVEINLGSTKNAAKTDAKSAMGKFLGDALQYIIVNLRNKQSRQNIRAFGTGDGMAAVICAFFAKEVFDEDPVMILDSAKVSGALTLFGFGNFGKKVNLNLVGNRLTQNTRLTRKSLIRNESNTAKYLRGKLGTNLFNSYSKNNRTKLIGFANQMKPHFGMYPDERMIKSYILKQGIVRAKKSEENTNVTGKVNVVKSKLANLNINVANNKLTILKKTLNSKAQLKNRFMALNRNGNASMRNRLLSVIKQGNPKDIAKVLTPLAAQKTNTFNNNRLVANTPSNGKITVKNLKNVGMTFKREGNVSLKQKSILTVRIINNNKELRRKFGLLKTKGDEKLKNAFLKLIRTAKSRSILEKKLYKFFKVTPPSS